MENSNRRAFQTNIATTHPTNDSCTTGKLYRYTITYQTLTVSHGHRCTSPTATGLCLTNASLPNSQRHSVTIENLQKSDVSAFGKAAMRLNGRTQPSHRRPLEILDLNNGMRIADRRHRHEHADLRRRLRL